MWVRLPPRAPAPSGSFNTRSTPKVGERGRRVGGSLAEEGYPSEGTIFARDRRGHCDEAPFSGRLSICLSRLQAKEALIWKVAFSGQIDTLFSMTAREVIDQIKTLPPPERAKVVDFVHEMEAGRTSVRQADDREFAEAAKWVMGEHTDLMRKLSQ